MAVVSAENFFIASNHVRSYLGTLKIRRLSSENYDWKYLQGGRSSPSNSTFCSWFHRIKVGLANDDAMLGFRLSCGCP